MKKLIKEIKSWVKENCFNAEHLVRTAYWVKKIEPKADEAVVIAALTHDADRGLLTIETTTFPEDTGEEISEFYLKHCFNCAKIVGKLLEEKEADKKLIKKVKNLIEKHEFGGTYEQNLVKDADSISFLEVNAPIFISFIPEKRTKDEVKRKFDWMFNRISSPKAKRLAKPFYEKAIAELEKVED